VTGVTTSNDIYPKTGTCLDLSSSSVDACAYPSLCKEDSDNWGHCPYCKTYKTDTNSGHGKLSLGNYVSGSGTADPWDPMIYTGGSATNCATGRSSEAVWYCWYDAFPTSATVAITSLDFQWLESAACEYTVYIYTPLACDFAK